MGMRHEELRGAHVRRLVVTGMLALLFGMESAGDEVELKRINDALLRANATNVSAYISDAVENSGEIEVEIPKAATMAKGK